MVTWERGGIMKKVTNSDIGGGRSKIWDFFGDVIFEWPHDDHVLQTNN